MALSNLKFEEVIVNEYLIFIHNWWLDFVMKTKNWSASPYVSLVSLCLMLPILWEGVSVISVSLHLKVISVSLPVRKIIFLICNSITIGFPSGTCSIVLLLLWCYFSALKILGIFENFCCVFLAKYAWNLDCTSQATAAFSWWFKECTWFPCSLPCFTLWLFGMTLSLSLLAYIVGWTCTECFIKVCLSSFVNFGRINKLLVSLFCNLL